MYYCIIPTIQGVVYITIAGNLLISTVSCILFSHLVNVLVGHFKYVPCVIYYDINQHVCGFKLDLQYITKPITIICQWFITFLWIHPHCFWFHSPTSHIRKVPFSETSHSNCLPLSKCSIHVAILILPPPDSTLFFSKPSNHLHPKTDFQVPYSFYTPHFFIEHNFYYVCAFAPNQDGLYNSTPINFFFKFLPFIRIKSFFSKKINYFLYFINL